MLIINESLEIEISHVPSKKTLKFVVVVRPVKSQKLKGQPKFKNDKSNIIKQKPSVKKRIKKIKKEATASDSFKAEAKKVVVKDCIADELLAERYPIFKNEELVKKFLSVTITNNQKGRIRQQLRDSLKGASDVILPDVIHNRIVAISKESNLTDAELRKIRLLYNMLRTSLRSEKVTKEVKNQSNSDKQKVRGEKRPNSDTVEDHDKRDASTSTEIDEVKTMEGTNNEINEVTTTESANTEINEVKTTESANTEINVAETIEREEVSDTKDVEIKKDMKKGKLKGPKRYVVFIGNLPLDIDKEKIMSHFSDVGDSIVDLRIPELIEGKKNRIAYLELKDQPTFELALSKNHTMLCNRRINVVYTTQKKSRITKTEAKGKAEKLKALQQSGMLIGSISSSKKRNVRRMKAKAAREAQDAST